MQNLCTNTQKKKTQLSSELVISNFCQNHKVFNLPLKKVLRKRNGVKMVIKKNRYLLLHVFITSNHFPYCSLIFSLPYSTTPTFCPSLLLTTRQTNSLLLIIWRYYLKKASFSIRQPLLCDRV